jgi:tRNA uridine 5-carboxymethylaminomethyl modification enzyme
VLGREPIVLGRDQSYIAVMIDDLVTKGTIEPYRMFTSRAEHRLLLRIDNADLRLTPIGREIGLVDDARWTRFEARRARYAANMSRLRDTTIRQADKQARSAAAMLARPGVTLEALTARGEVSLDVDPAQRELDIWSVETAIKYEGYLVRQAAQVNRSRRDEAREIPNSIEYAEIPGLSRESVERLTKVRPETLGQASRVPGVTPAATAAIGVFLERRSQSFQPHADVPRVPATAWEASTPGGSLDRP